MPLSEAIFVISDRIRRRYARFERKYFRDLGSVEGKFFCELLDCLSEASFLAAQHEEATRERIERLERERDELRKRLALTPSNSSKAPSSESFKKIKNSRQKTSRQHGGQKGHKGHHHEFENQVDRVRREEPSRCRSCGLSLQEVAADQVICKQEIDIKEGKMFVTEFQSVVKYCPKCGDMNRAWPVEMPKSKVVFGSNAKAIAVYLMVHQLLPFERTQEALRDLFGIAISQGTLSNFMRQCSKRLTLWKSQTQKSLAESAVAHFDETGIRCEKRSDWVHVASTESLTLLSFSRKRGKEGAEEAGVLPYFKGTAIHDGFASYFKFNQCRHALCNAHLLRDLKFLHEEESQKWAHAMQRLIQKSIHRINAGMAISSSRVERQFKKILRVGFKENGYERDWKKREPDGYKWSWENGKRVQVAFYRRRGHSKAMQVLNRLRNYSKEFLLFVFDPTVPATNNQAERDLRMAKLKAKISGCFRSQELAESFLIIKSFLSTSRKQQQHLISSLQENFAIV